MAPTEAPLDHRLILVDGVLDGIAARRVEATLARAAAGQHLHVDLSQVRESHDFALAVLANAVAHCPAQVTLHGLRQHQIRLLGYFGVEAGALGGPELFEAA